MDIKGKIKNYLWTSWLKKALKQTEVMKNQNNTDVKKLAVIIEESLLNTLSTEEKYWVDRIEKLRNSLNKDNTSIEVTDFGAGDPKSKRTDEEMYKGVDNLTSVSDICKASKPPVWALLLLKLVKDFHSKTVIELGTCLGISAAYQAAGQEINQEGKLITLEGSDSLAKIAENNLNSLNCKNVSVIPGRFQNNLEKILKENKPVDYVFVDGHHDEKATINYFNLLLPYLSEKAVIVFDDISWSSGMKTAWLKVQEHNMIKIIVDLKTIGICILDNTAKEKLIYNF